MKMEWWEQGGDWWLLLSDRRMALVTKILGAWRIGGFHSTAEKYDTLEAAKSAAERAVKEWLRACLGEPVACYDADAYADPEIRVNESYLILSPKFTHPEEGMMPLYALEADE